VIAISHDGRDGLFRATGEDWDLLIVDRMLPAIEGAHLVRTLRTGNINTPVLFLTTMSGVGDRVAGLNAGGDDYLVKPFAFAELVARVNALGRRRFSAPAPSLIRVGDLEIDLMSRTVRRGGAVIPLQPREFRLLAYMMRHAGEVVTRTMLLENVWDFHFEPRTNIVETHISRLRSKLHRPGVANPIQTVRGAGYLLNATS
jgi:two-component system, OmpR family, response regulator